MPDADDSRRAGRAGEEDALGMERRQQTDLHLRSSVVLLRCLPLAGVVACSSSPLSRSPSLGSSHSSQREAALGWQHRNEESHQQARRDMRQPVMHTRTKIVPQSFHVRSLLNKFSIFNLRARPSDGGCPRSSSEEHHIGMFPPNIAPALFLVPFSPLSSPPSVFLFSECVSLPLRLTSVFVVPGAIKAGSR